MVDKRIRQINEYLFCNTKTIYRLRKIQEIKRGGKEICAYAVSLAKSEPLSLEEQVQQFYDNCKNVLVPGEILTTEDRCFRIIADSFEVAYCLEAWRKTADKVAYIECEQIKIELLHRMSCEQAASVFKEKEIDPLKIIESLETLNHYTNPADKYAALAKFPLLCIAAQDAIEG
ncbi:MAG: hypothetical protein IJO72_06435 [Oscillospiraceae bacterium]|nr:hypothetical protein [Oscillospiraceae bacterium]